MSSQLNIICKAFGGENAPVLTQALQPFSIGTCVTIVNHQEFIPEVPAEEHCWYSQKELIHCQYPQTDWHKLLPLDEELIEAMRPYEAVFLNMVGRYGVTRPLSYEERKRQYFQHARYWNHIIETKSINVFLSNNIPHHGFDFIIYGLCKHKGIPTLCLDRCGRTVLDAVFITYDWEEPAPALKNKFVQLQKEKKTTATMELSKRYEYFYRLFTEKQQTPRYVYQDHIALLKKNFVSKWSEKSFDLLKRSPKRFIRAISSPGLWKRKWQQHTTYNLYDSLTKQPDISNPYVYFPLHYQPEATTVPKSGAFCEQELVAQLLLRYLPEDISLYIKEHPNQGEMCRSKTFYHTLANLPRVTLVPRNMNTFQLMKNAKAVATGTGTAGFEALFWEIPVILFGHRFYQYAPGVFEVRSHQDCKKAIHAIFKERIKLKREDMRLFLKAMEETGCPYLGGPDCPDVPLSDEEKVCMMGKYIAEELKRI